MFEIRVAQTQDIEILAHLFQKAFTEADPKKPWGYEHSLNLMRYWYEKQPDLFYVAVRNETLVGGMVANIKPWRDGNRCQDAILFVDPNEQKSGIGTQLFKKILSESIKKYRAKIFEGITFANNQFPLTWYKKIGFEKDTEAIVVKGDCKEMLGRL